MAEGKDYEAVLTEEDDQNKVPFEGAEEESKEATGRSSEESIELIVAHEWDGHNDESYDAETIRKKQESSLQRTVAWDEYKFVKEAVTATALMNVGKNPLLLSIKISEKLRERAARSEDNEDDFNALAEQVEEFTLRFLDPLKHFYKCQIKEFCENPELDLIFETATKLGQKKFFGHHVVGIILSHRWYTEIGRTWKIDKPGLWLFLQIWCLVDVVLFPLLFSIALILDWITPRLRAMFQSLRRQQEESYSGPVRFVEMYKDYFTIPYFVFLRDMISYLALVALHIAICLESSQLAISDLEWAILIFFCGRLLVETKQIADIARSEDKEMRMKILKNYLRDCWNLFDLVILCMYFCGILPLRIVTWASSESASNNEALEVAGYLYGFNTMLLTFRAFGALLEAFEGVGTIQIALFQVIRDAVVIVVHFVVITVAFSSAITKVFLSSTGVQEDTKKYSWLGITSQLGLSLLDLSDGLDYFRSADSSSETLARCLFAAYLVIALIILVNMLIALLSNTYQKVQDDSRREWVFQKAVTIQTYGNYHPIPVPFNIISTFLMLFPSLRIMNKTPRTSTEYEMQQMSLWGQDYARTLKRYYRRQYGESFPPTEPLQQIAEQTNNTESVVIQILHKTFTSDKALLPTGPEAWDAHDTIRVEGCLLTSLSHRPVEPFPRSYRNRCSGARYRSNFSPTFPHFEMMIRESLETSCLTLGVVCESWDCETMPGFGGTIGFNTDVRIFDFNHGQLMETLVSLTGVDKIRQNDVIQCTVMFEHEEERDGEFHVPVMFTVNGIRVESDEDHRFIKSKPDDPLYPFIGFWGENSALAKMRARDDVDYQDLQLQEVKSELTEMKSQLNDVGAQLREAMSKLDAVLTKAGENKESQRKTNSPSK